MSRLLAALFCLVALELQTVRAEEFILADSSTWPGKLWNCREDGRDRVLHGRDVNPLSSAPGMIPRLAQACVNPGGKLFFCSGLDGYIFGIVDGRHEVVSCQLPGEQIRDVAAGENDHTYYFTVVPTPQNGAALVDGKVYRYDFYTGGPKLIATVKQADVGNEFWGTIALNQGDIYVATLGSTSRVYRLQGNQPELVWNPDNLKITGMTFDVNGDLFFANGSKQIFRVRDFRDVQPVVNLGRNVTDVTVAAAK